MMTIQQLLTHGHRNGMKHDTNRYFNTND